MTRFVNLVFVALATAALASAAFAQQTRPTDEVVAVVTALSHDASVTLGEEPATVGSSAGLYAGEPLRVEVKGGAQGGREVMLRIDALAANILSVRAAMELELSDKRELAIRAQLGTDGLVDVYHDVDSPAIAVRVGDVSVRLGRGILRIHAVADGVEILSASGAATVEAGTARVALEARAANRTLVRGTTIGAATRVETAREIAGSRARIVQNSLLRDLIRVAESAAEGDIEPPARGSAVPIAAIATAVRVSEVVPRGGGPTSFSGAAAQGSSVAGQGTSTAETFLTSGQAALAVVGARIQATRIIGGSAGSAALGVNSQFRRRFTLGSGNR